MGPENTMTMQSNPDVINSLQFVLNLPRDYFLLSLAMEVQVNMSKADSMDSQWRAAASGYAAQVLHPERSGPQAPLSWSHCSSSWPLVATPRFNHDAVFFCSHCSISLNGASPWYSYILALPEIADANKRSLFSIL